MTLRLFFIVLAAMVLGLGALGAVAAFDSAPLLFFAAEGVTLAAAVFLIFFYRRIMRPLDALVNGLDILRAQDWNTTLRHVGQSEVDSIADTFNHMLERLKEQRIRYEERSRLVDLLIQSAPTGVVILGFDGRPMLVNRAGRGLLDASAGLEPFIRRLDEGAVADYITAGGNTLRCSCHSFVDRGMVHRFYIIEDITASVSAAERSAYEKIIRIISHEVNNTVAGLSSAFDTLGYVLEDMPGMDDCRALMRSCDDRSRSLSEFIGRYSEVVKIPPVELKPRSLAQFVGRAAPFLQSIGAPAGVRVEVSAAGDAPAALIDEALLEQALVNIVKNAVESVAALPGGPSAGRVTVCAMADGGRPVIEVCDNGPGISEEKARRIFTPFYTDKPQGQGIGLTFVRDVLARHGARFSLATADGVTRFRIELAGRDI